MKLLFLDIDGVLNCHAEDFREALITNDNAWKKTGDVTPLTCNGKYMIRPAHNAGYMVHVDLLNRLKHIIEVTGCEIIGVSSWFSGDHIDIGEFLGITIQAEGYDTCGGVSRFHGVRDWIRDYKPESAVILDDLRGCPDDLLPIFVQPQCEGLTEELMNDCIRILETPLERDCNA